MGIAKLGKHGFGVVYVSDSKTLCKALWLNCLAWRINGLKNLETEVVNASMIEV